MYDIPTTAAAAVNSVEYLQTDGTHHMTLSTTALAETPIEPGDYDCADLYANSSVMQDVVMMFGNQGDAAGTLTLPDGGAHTEWSRCVMNEDVEVQFLASHTHALATEFTIAPYDGAVTGEVFYTNADWHDPMIEQYTTPMVVPAGQGFEFACTWFNDGEETINYGLLSTDEMCNMAIVFTPFSVTAECEVVETSDGYLGEE